jgi:hypothetical protein
MCINKMPFGDEFLPFCAKKLVKKIMSQIFSFKKKCQFSNLKNHQIPTIAYNMKRCLRFPTFIF